ncbi:MAG TPA: cyclodeaminase/cyclohydrolase family protein [Actinocrinis sp.]|nr:cyclodeaminase/cyclohydrolase family protein [Actinocrinis sp.]
MRDETIGGFLDRLAARVPAPGGGASAALHAAQAAALVGMVARYSDGAKYAAHREQIDRITAETDRLRGLALDLAAQDADAFAAVAAAYKLPKDTEDAAAARTAAIATALIGAARPPADVITTAGAVLACAEELLPYGNRNVITDVAAAAEAARAAATTARLNIEINLSFLPDAAVRAPFEAAAAEVDGLAARAERITATVRQEIAA